VATDHGVNVVSHYRTEPTYRPPACFSFLICVYGRFLLDFCAAFYLAF